MSQSILKSWGPTLAGFLAAAVIAAAFLTLNGCGSPQPGEQAGNAVESLPNTGANGSPVGPGSTSSNSSDPGIMPMGGGVAAPVTNPGAVEGGGSAAGTIAKDRARSAAQNASQPTAVPDGE